ncbi:hypothetical protein BLNAU_10981 [Blattamonas nauphoetae]|uniref:Uncharacterized protein n=1 Tax=Blattamonas nauphoetae TaxID=2049346 RepID=A0ABQ9XRE7_9EUKA|nr:hypothetical protein BLNAU_10981 [Blattamonas nauphoetae]
MTSSEEYSPFLNWTPTEPITADSIGRAIISLVSMIRDSYQFDEDLVHKASTFISSISSHLFEYNFADDLLTAIGQAIPDPIPAFVDSMTVLLSSSHPSISLLVEVEHEHTNEIIIRLILDVMRKWQINGAETMHRGRILLQTLEQEGIHSFFSFIVMSVTSNPSEIKTVRIRFPNRYSRSLELAQTVTLHPENVVGQSQLGEPFAANNTSIGGGEDHL